MLAAVFFQISFLRGNLIGGHAEGRSLFRKTAELYASTVDVKEDVRAAAGNHIDPLICSDLVPSVIGQI